MTTITRTQQPTVRLEAADPALSVVVPAYNEAAAIRPVLERLLPEAAARDWEVLVVDDGSSDGTGALLDELAPAHAPTLRAIHHLRNRGYGAALKTGIRAARAPKVAMMDSDGQHTLDMLLSLLPLSETHEMVIGRRTNIAQGTLWRAPGKWVLRMMAVYLLGERIPDLNSGLRVLHTNVIRRYLHLFPNGFSFSTTSTMILLSRGYGVAYAPIDVQARRGKSTVSWRTGFNTLMLILRLAMLLNPLRIFLPLSALLFLSGSIWALPYLLARRGLTVTALLFILMAVIVFLIGLLADQIAELRKERFEFPESW